MNRKVHSPVILAFPSSARNRRADSPARRRESRLERCHRLRCVTDTATDDVADNRLAAMRVRLLRMIIENERMRNDGPRAS
jgi:hypothetical protein